MSVDNALEHFSSLTWAKCQVYVWQWIESSFNTHSKCRDDSSRNSDHVTDSVVRLEHGELVLLQVFVVSAGQTFQRHHEARLLLVNNGWNVLQWVVNVLGWFGKLWSLTKPNSVPLLPRINSRLSAFFFWGMRLLPVLQSNSKVFPKSSGTCTICFPYDIVLCFICDPRSSFTVVTS